MAQKRVQPSAYVQLVHEIEGPGICGLTQPFRVAALANGTVFLNTTATLDCAMTAELDDWLRDVVQPAARQRFGSDVTGISTMSSYSCRGMNNQPGASLSEHAFGNAFDVSAFSLADGRTISVRREWSGENEQARAFLREVQGGACDRFTTVLAPGSNAYHYDHIHLDLAMHGGSSRGPRRICKPAQTEVAPAPRRDNLPDAPDLEEETDVARAPAPSGRTYAGMGSRVPAALPPPVPARVNDAPRPRSAGGTPARMRSDGAFVPEDDPSDWDATSSIGRR